MNRRDFLKKGIGSVFFLSGSAVMNTSYIHKLFSDEELVLLGLKEPGLCSKFNLQNAAAEAFHDMLHDARKAGIKMYSVSGYRSYYRQKHIYQEKYRNMKAQTPVCHKVENIIQKTAIPGTSRHHWGTEIDVIDLYGDYNIHDPLIQKNYRQGGTFQYLNYWLEENAAKYGFYVSYTADENRCGFDYEPWHLSFKELARPMLRDFLKIDLDKFYKIRNDIPGLEYIREQGFLDYYKERHVLGINDILL